MPHVPAHVQCSHATRIGHVAAAVPVCRHCLAGKPGLGADPHRLPTSNQNESALVAHQGRASLAAHAVVLRGDMAAMVS